MTISDCSGARLSAALIVAEEATVAEHLRQLLKTSLQRSDLDIRTAAGLTAARQTASDWAPDAVLLLLDSTADADVVTAIRRLFPDSGLLVLTSCADPESWARVFGAQADAILTYGDELPGELGPHVQQTLETSSTRRCCRQLTEQLHALQEELARSRTALAEEMRQRGHLETLFQSHRADYLAILDSAPAMIWYVDKAGVILRANTRAADSLGIPVNILIGQDYYRLCGARHNITVAEDQAIMHSGRPRCGVITCTHEPDGEHWFRIDRIPWTDQTGRITGITVFAADVTDAVRSEAQLKAAKDEIECINAQLRLAARQAQAYADEAIAANRIKSHFLANVTHELRTPMNAIIGYGDLLADEQLSLEQKKYVDIIQKSAQNLLALIDDVLDFSKIEAGRLDVCIRPCDPRELLSDVHDLMKQTACAKGLAFELAVGDLPPMISTDGHRLRQCLMNLVGNALKFTDAGSVRISTSVSGIGEQGLLRIDVADTGIGIAPDKQQHIFESFVQADTSVSAARGGTGLGLTITKRLMELLGGAVELVSEVGKGSTFSLLLPVSPPLPSAEGEEPGIAACEAESPARFAGTVLLVESEPSSRLLTHLMLSRAGLRVDEACDGCSAAQKARQNRYDLILIDAGLPAPDGTDVVRQLRAEGLMAPLIALCTHGDSATREACLQAGFSDCLVKPFARKDLYDLLARHIGAPAGRPA